MEKIITIVCNIISFLLLIIFINDYAGIVVGMTLLILISLLIFYIIKYRKKYIDKNVICVFLLCLFLQYILIYLLKIFDIFEVSSGYMGLGGGGFGILFYQFIYIIFSGLIIVINMFKFILNKIRTLKHK